MTEPDIRDTAPGAGDPTRSDDLPSDGLRSDTAGSGAGRNDEGDRSASGPAPSGSVGPDGEDVQASSGPGPQSDWLRSATGDGSQRGSGDAQRTDLDPQETEAGRP